MKNSLLTIHPRRPHPIAQWHRTPVADLPRPVPASDTHRIHIQSFLLPEMLPYGPPRNSAVLFPFVMTVGGDYVLQGRVERSDAGPILAVECLAYDRADECWVTFDCPPDLQAQAYREAGRKYTSEQARRNTREGRN